MKRSLARMLLICTIVSSQTGKSQNCGYSLGMQNGQSICYGYAMARASGLDNPTTWNANSIYAYQQYFTFSTTPQYQVGDIIVFALPGTSPSDINGSNGHATYVSAINSPNNHDGLLYLSPNGIARDDDIHPPTDDSQIICMQVPYQGGNEETKTLAQVKSSVSPMVAIGFYRLLDTCKCAITFQNSFTGGWITVGKWDDQVTSIDRQSPYSVPLPRLATISAQVITPQQDNSGDWHTFNNQWTYSHGSYNTAQIDVQVSSTNETYTAQFVAGSPTGSLVSFENKWNGISFGSIVKVNNEDKISPTRDFTMGATATAYSILDYNGIEYTFVNWMPGGSTNLTITPTAAGRYTANYSARPLPPINVAAGAPVGSYVSVSWADYENADISHYEIWRYPKGTSPQWIVNVNKGIQHWTDRGYKVTGTGTDQMIFYDVHSFFQLDTSTSDPATAIATATMVNGGGAQANESNKATRMMRNIPGQYSVSSYPNPFNPSTTISYQLVEDSDVLLEIYDLMGRKVATLVAGHLAAGEHTSLWSGQDASGVNVASGIYLFRLSAKPIGGAQPFVSSGKLVMMK